ncbi:Concanavalin A-like lectin/glucanase, subgroup, partial [Cynara cardunculus var. scolymus]
MKTFVLMWVLLQMLSLFTASDTNFTSDTYTLINSTNLAKPNCSSQCGDVIVPYPFGFGNNTNCSISPEFHIHCNTSLHPPKLSIYEDSYTSITHISDSTIRISNLVSSRCYLPNGTISNGFNISVNYIDLPYTLSGVNKFRVIGCDDFAWLISGTESRDVLTGCAAICATPQDVVSDQCSGNGCCETSISRDINYFRTQVKSMEDSDNMSYTRSFNPCTYAFVGEENVFKFKGETDLNNTFLAEKIEAEVPIVLEWAIGNLSCVEVEATDGFACQSNSKCVNSTRESRGYRCICNDGYEGNPYLSPGCKDIDECKHPDKFPCYGTCFNTEGNYTCKCKRGHSGDAKIQDGCRRKPFHPLVLSIGMGCGLLTILIVLLVSYFVVKKKKLVMLREKFFEQNGGMLLEEKLKTKSGVGVGAMKLFGVGDLEQATDKYAEHNILGRGGNGIVYKGTLLDNRVVAIKKSQRLDQRQREQFINEMVILTQINHQNVVQLLGCCLETDVPLLVYEFISNGTLHHHIHSRKSGVARLSWDSRLRIAHESAGALAYLHSDARMPIIHRDVKSSNILLDESYTAKIADFGASRLIPLGDHNQVTTLVQGTLGYLDPEYLRTGQLTDKSDVYSFGVVLAELLTGKKPIAGERCLAEQSLATYFEKAMKENQILEILEFEVVKEATDEQLKATCDLTCRCLNQLGEKRPNMKTVAVELETLRKFRKHPWVSEDNYIELSSLMIENKPNDLYEVPLITNSDTFGES